MPRITNELDAAELAVFGENVRTERTLHGWSIERLAQLAELATDTVFRVEKGQPSTKRSRIRICKALQSSYARMLMRPQTTGKGFAIHRQSEDWWVVHWGKRQYRHLDDESDRIQEAQERRRLGGLGFVSHFVQMLNCRLPKGKLVAGVLEIFGEGAKSKYLSGEVLVYVLDGSVRVVFGEDEFVLNQGEAATIQCAVAEFFFAPTEPEMRVPPRLLYVRLDVGAEDAQMKEEELAQLIREWES
jgi:transcriptional regulator with XRE-family HTH domain